MHLKSYLKSLKLHASDTGVICSCQFTTTSSSRKQQFILISIQIWIYSYQEWDNHPKKVYICWKHTGCLCKMILSTNCCGSISNWNKAMWHLTPHGHLTPLYPTIASYWNFYGSFYTWRKNTEAFGTKFVICSFQIAGHVTSLPTWLWCNSARRCFCKQ